jgi:hypothetical protein
MKVNLCLGDHPVQVVYHIHASGRGVASLVLNGVELDFIRERNPYRLGAIRIGTEVFKSHLTGAGDVLVISMA